jgi:hypothetical protein
VASRLALHVSPRGDDRWSGRLAEPTADHRDGPFATPQRARDAIRALKHEGRLPAGVTVWLRGGRYPLREPLVFEPEDSAPVTWAAWPGETPVLDGGVRVSGWKASTIGALEVWTADVSALLKTGRRLRQLFVNGERRSRPRLPREGFWRPEEVAGLKPGDDVWERLFEGTDTFRAAPGTFRAFRNLADVEIVAYHFWIEERLSVASFDPATRLVRTARPSLMAFLDESGRAYPRYLAENVFEALAPGEWYLDRPTGRLHYAPRAGERPDATEIVVPVAPALVRLAGQPESGRFLEFLRFQGIAFAYAEPPETPPAGQAAWTVPGAIEMVGARHVAIEGGRLEGLGGYAVEVGDGCDGVQLVGNLMADLGAGGVKVTGSDAAGDPRRRTARVRITDNEIRGYGRVFPSAVGVLVRHAADVAIAHNHIHDGFYTAVSAGWVWGYADSVTRAVRIEDNHIHDIGQGLLSDMGGVYLLGVQPGTVVRGNLIHDVTAAQYGGWGIYPDEGSSQVIIEDNAALRTSAHAFHQHYGGENVVRNNLFALGRQGIVALSRGPGWNGGRGRYAFTFERNLVVADGVPAFVGGLGGPSGEVEGRPFASDLNVLWDVSGAPVVSGNGGHSEGRASLRKSYGLAEWQSLGYDRHSVAADPRLRDLARLDFALDPASPALALGFRPLDFSGVGPRPEERRAEVP